MILFAAALYAITAITLPPGQTVGIDDPPFHSAPNTPPTTFALSRRGSLAVLLRPDSNDAPKDAVNILVVRIDGTRVTLSLPPAIVRGVPSASFSGIALASDGTPFATASTWFSGARGGTTDAIFSWNGKQWRDVLEGIALPIDTRNVTIAAADSGWTFAANANYYDAEVDTDSLEVDPHYQENQAILVNGDHPVKLGYGVATAMRGRFVVGYTNGARSFGIKGEPPHKSTALEWTNGRRRALGPGIAYGVNDRGDAVGDNDPYLSAKGTPTLWQAGRTVRLCDVPGSAYAIGDDGTIVGEINDSAFLVRGSDTHHEVVRIDELLGRSAWHVNAAYAIAAVGRILATGRQAHGPLTILLLDPK